MAIGALLAILAASGCSTEAEPDAAATSLNAAASTAAAPSTDAASSSAPPSPTEEASEEAGADSADYESCGDGECEVSFSGSVEFPLGGADGEWTVEAAIEADGVKVNLTDPDGMGGGGGLLHQPACTLTIRADGGGGLSCAEEGEDLPEPEAGGYVVHLLELTGDTAVIEVALG
jgi:hypothetical protein